MLLPLIYTGEVKGIPGPSFIQKIALDKSRHRGYITLP